MKKEYSDQDLITIRFEPDQVKELNRLAIGMEIPRNIVIKKLVDIVLEDVKLGRSIFALPNDEHRFDGSDPDNEITDRQYMLMVPVEEGT